MIVIVVVSTKNSSLSASSFWLYYLHKAFGICPFIDQRAAGGQPSACGLASYAVIKAETKDAQHWQ